MVTKKLYIFIFLLIGHLNIHFNNYSEAIIFDLYGVLFHIPKLSQLSYMGLKDPINYAIRDRKNPANWGHEFARHLENIELDNKLKSQLPEKILPLVYHKPMAPIVYLWQVGQIKSDYALQLALDYIHNLKNISKTERNMLIKTSLAAFDIETRKKLYKPIPEGVELLKKCAQAVDKDNEPKHFLYILSNMDDELINYLIETYPEIFDLFKEYNEITEKFEYRVVYSTARGMAKPEERLFEDFLRYPHPKAKNEKEQYQGGLNPRNCIFIDDQLENILAAQKLGIKSIHCKDFKEVTNELIRAGALKPEKEPCSLRERIAIGAMVGVTAGLSLKAIEYVAR